MDAEEKHPQLADFEDRSEIIDGVQFGRISWPVSFVIDEPIEE